MKNTTIDTLASATRLFEALGLPQPTVSRHLAYLRKAGLVAGRKEGLWVHYRRSKPVGELQRSLLHCVGTSLDDPEVFPRDRERLARLLACENC